jgi:hypothetical protein
VLTSTRIIITSKKLGFFISASMVMERARNCKLHLLGARQFANPLSAPLCFPWEAGLPVSAVSVNVFPRRIYQARVKAPSNAPSNGQMPVNCPF